MRCDANDNTEDKGVQASEPKGGGKWENFQRLGVMCVDVLLDVMLGWMEYI